jgi:hypothetical protein
VQAAASSKSVGEDVGQVDTDLKSNATLSNFSTFSSEHQQQDQMGIAFLGWVEKMYTGQNRLLSQLDAGINDAAIEALAGELTTGEAGVAGGGVLDGAFGAEALDVATTAGWVSTTSVVGLALIPIGGLLAYEDIVTGTNRVTTALYSGTEDQAKIEEEGGVGAEGLRWVHYPAMGSCPGEKRLPECLFAYYSARYGGPSSAEHELKEVEHVNTGLYELGGSVQPPVEPFGSWYFMQVKVGGIWYQGSEGNTTGSTPSMLEVGPWNWVAYESGGCGYPTVAGWPTNLRHVATTILSNIHAVGECEPEYYVHRYVYSAVGIRAPSRMHIGLPHVTTEAAVTKLKEEGHTVISQTGKNTETGHAPEVAKKVDEKLKEKGQRRLEEGACHWMECEKQSHSAEPETTPYEPPLPAKEEGVSPSLPGLVIVPTCTFVEISGAACVETLKEHGFTKTKIEELGWEHAVITKPPLTTIRTSPAEGTEVETATEVNVIENPDSEHFPVAVPAIGYGHETATEYKARIEGEGWSKVEVKTLTEAATDPHIGPNQASYTVPAAGDETAPGKATDITVEANPSTAPAPEGGGGISGPTIPPLKFLEVPTPCDKFPFGVPCWLAARMIEMATSTRAPKFGIPLEGHVMHVNFEEADKEMEIVRAVEAVLGTIGVVLMFGAFASSSAGSSGGGGDD